MEIQTIAEATYRNILRRLDYCPTWLALPVGIGAGVLGAAAVLTWMPAVVGAALFVLLLGGAALLAWSGEPVARLEMIHGMSDMNRPEHLPELQAEVLRHLQDRSGMSVPLFANPLTQREMLARDHTFDAQHLEVKAELKRLLHLEAFGAEPVWDPILLTAVGRLVEQKNLGLVADIIDRTLAYDAGTKFIVLASAPEEDQGGRATETAFAQYAARYPGRVYFNRAFNQALSRLILAGGDFCLIPSRFEPCGLVDYEASLLGNIVIGRATGGLTKVRHCAYLYDWLDISDRAGEAAAFFAQIAAAITTYRHSPARHTELIHMAMVIDASTTVVDRMLSWFHTLSGGRNHGAEAGAGRVPRRRGV